MNTERAKEYFQELGQMHKTIKPTKPEWKEYVDSEKQTVLYQEAFSTLRKDARERKIQKRATRESTTWLLAPDRSWDEINSFLEVQLQAVQSHITERRTNDASINGTEKPISGNVARIMAYASLYDQQNVSKDKANGEAVSARASYDQAKAEIKASKASQGKKQKQIVDLWKHTYNKKVQDATQQGKDHEKIQQFILKKAVLDIFSVDNTAFGESNPLVTQDFATLIADAKNATLQPQSSENTTSPDRQPVDSFLDGLTTYLENTKDKNLFAKYKYRNSSDIVTKTEDCQVLDACLQLSLDANNLTSQPSDAKKLERLGNAYFSFLKRRVSSTSELNQNETYPHVSLVYDILTSAMYRGTPAVLAGVSGLVDANMADVLYSSTAKREINTFLNTSASLQAHMYAVLGEQLFQLHIFDKNLHDKLPPEVIDFFTNTESRMYNGLWAFQHRDSITEQREPMQKSKAVGAILSHMKTIDLRHPIPLPDQLFDASRQFIGFLPHGIFLHDKGIEIDLHYLLPGEIRVSDKETDIQEVIKDFPTMIADFSGYSKAAMTDILTRQYSINLFDKQVNVEQIEKENSFFWREILDKPMWFVSPRGDRYTKDKDPQLGEFAIESIQFDIDKSHPREHKITMRLSGFDFSFEYWLDTKRKLLNTSHQVMSMNANIQNAFTNIFLKRLYFITSGLMAKEQEERPKEGEGGRWLEYRRAHYRKLTSTTTRPITMESPQALAHAQEMKRRYGVDIFVEIARRRAIGTLKQNEYLTFVKEVEPEFVVSTALPNEISFQPELIQIPV